MAAADETRAFTLAQLSRDAEALARRRGHLVRRIGAEAVADAAAVAAFFDGMNRVAEATGTELDEAAAG